MSDELHYIEVHITYRGKTRLLHKVSSSCKYRNMSWFSKLSFINDSHLIKAAKELMNGWRHNGPYPGATFKLIAFPWKGVPYEVKL